MKKKRSLNLLLIVALVACMLFACQPAVDPVSLVDFADETVSIGLGETYTLPSDSVTDTKNNDYRVYYTVKTSEGKDVAVARQQFIANNESGYRITATTETLPDGSVKTRIITLNVVDENAPNIVIGSTSVGYEGKQYTLPEIDVTDSSSGKVEVVTKVYFVDGNNETEVDVTDGKFIPTTRGIYRIKVTATDSSQNVAEKSADVYIRSALKDFTFEDFDDELGMGALTLYENGHMSQAETWHSVFDPTPETSDNGDEKVGVAEGTSTTNSYGPHLYMQFPSALNDTDFEYVYTRIYIKSAIAQYKAQVNIYSFNYHLGTFPVNEWVDVRMDVDDINDPNANFDKNKGEGETGVDVFKNVMTANGGNVLFWIQMGTYTGEGGQTTSDVPGNYVFYIDEIGYKPYIQPSLDVEESYELGEYITLNAKLDGSINIDNYEFDYTVTAPSGQIVTLDGDNKFRAVEEGEYTVTVNFVHSAFTGSKTFTFVVVSDKQIAVDDITGSYSAGDTVTLPVATIEGGTVNVRVYLGEKEIAINENAFVAKLPGTYTVVYTTEIDGLTYKKEIEVSVEDIVFENEVLGFDSEDDLQKFGIGLNINSPQLTWLSEYEGELGVVKASWDSGSEWPWFSFVPTQEMSAYADYDYIVFRILVPDHAGAAQYFKLFNDQGALSPVNGAEIVLGEWKDYVFDATRFKEEWSTRMDSYNADLHRLWTKVSKDSSGAFYIADISMAKAINEDDFSITVTGDKTEGETLSLTYTAVAGASVTLTDPEGDKVSDLNSFTAIAGEYTVTFTADGYFGKVVKTFIVSNTPTSVTVITEAENATVVYGQESYEIGETVTFTVSVLDGREIVSVSVDETPLTATNGGYLFTATANVHTVTVVVKINVSANEVISFDRSADIDNLLTPALNLTYSKAWLSEYEGANGVAKITYKGSNQYPQFTFTPLQSLDKYADYDYIVFRMYVSGTSNGKPVSFAMYSDTAVTLTGSVTSMVYDKWTDYVFDATRFKSEWDSNSVQPYQVWFRTAASSASDEGTVYVDNIYMANASDISTQPENPENPENPDLPEVSSASEVISFDSESDTSRITMGANVTAPTITWLSEYAGQTGVAKISWSSSIWPYLYFLPKQEMSAYADYDKIVFRMYVPDTGNKLLFMKLFNDLNADSPEGYFEAMEYNKWVDFTFDATRFKNEWTTGNDFTNYPGLNRFWFKSSSSSAVGEFYIASIHMTKSA